MGDAAMIGRTRTGMGFAVACVLATSLAGCSGADKGVELNGKVFDVVGLGGGKPSEEPRLAERAPLVPPPRMSALPTPGAVPEPGNHMAWPDDPDQRRAAAAKTGYASVNCNTLRDKLQGRPEIEQVKAEADCRAAQDGGVFGSLTSFIAVSILITKSSLALMVGATSYSLNHSALMRLPASGIGSC